MIKKFKIYNFITLVFFTLVSIFSSNGQILEGLNAEKKLHNAEIIKISSVTGNIQYALLSHSDISDITIEKYLQKVYHFKSNQGLKLIRKEHDEIGFEHYRFQQICNGVPVLGGIIIAHFKNNKLHSFNGEIYDIGLNENKQLLSIENCLKIALDSIHADIYKWQVPEEELSIKELKNDITASWYPIGELVYCPSDFNYNNPKLCLAYKFKIYADKPLIGENIYIDAENGKIVARENLIHTTNVNGVASTKYSGSQAIATDSTAPGNYRLRETTRGNGVTTLNLKTGTSYGAAVDFTDADNSWNNVNAAKDEVATDCHWGAGKTFDFFKARFNRNSYDNNNAKITSYVHYSSNYDNAFWNGLYMTYGDGSSFKPLTSVDVCGHEIAHAVTSNSANLVYSYESGALNESFSDIFGNAIERYAKPSNYSWIIGEEITFSGTGLRNMKNPTVKGHPRCYKSLNWYYGSGDNGGVHLNSGVQNWWFYLITEGGTGTNDASNSYKVDSLGILKAEQIAYRNLTVYLTPSSQYSDARFYSIRSATDLYGNCSKEVIAVTNAWHACNVGAKYDSGYVKADFIADTIVCNKNNLVKFLNFSTNAKSAKWYFGDGVVSSLYNTNHTYSTYGSFTIKLVVASCFKNRSDSLTKTAYVVVDSTFDICNAELMPLNGNDSTSKCNSFVYDEAGEGKYKQSFNSNLRISIPGADSIKIKFYDLDYEFRYDSIIIYRGKYPGGTKLAGFTGSTLPYGGATVAFAGSMFTLRHISDPYVIGRGFKLFYKAIKKPIKIKAFSDTTICYGNSTLLFATGVGGYFKNYLYQWQNIATNDSILVSPLSTKVYKVSLKDVCTQSTDSAQVTVAVRNPLKVSINKDTSICVGQTILLNATSIGGKRAAYTYTWNNGLSNDSSHSVSPNITTTYKVILSDGCTPKNDTASVNITVKAPLQIKINTIDTNICYNKTANLNTNAQGGNGNYSISWSHGLGIGNSKNISLTNSTWISATLTDGCTVLPSKDSVFITVSDPLTVNLNNDSTICNGRSILLNAISNGGKSIDYIYQWSNSLPANSSNIVVPTSKTKYFVTLTDNCSDSAIDSILVDILAPLAIQLTKDTTICIGQSVPLNTFASGGESTKYDYTWTNGLSNLPTHLVSPTITTSYQIVLSDACTVLNDTALVNITVNNPLSLNLSTADSIICYNKNASISSALNGGNGNYTLTWNNGLGIGNSKSINLSYTTWVKAILTDGCTVLPVADSILITVRDPLQLNLNNDTTICKGTFVNLNALADGGNSVNYSYVWSNSLPSTISNSVSPSSTTKYYLTLKDNCSDNAFDSILVNVLPALKISGLKDTAICFGGTANLLPIVKGGKSANYQFQWNNGLGTNLNQLVSPKVTKSYKLLLKDNCTVPYDSMIVNVIVRLPLSINTALNKNSICTGDSSKLSLTLGGGIPSQYEWYIDGVRNFNYVNYLKPVNTKIFNVVLKDNCSENDTNLVNLVVNQSPIIDFKATDTMVCEPGFFQFNNLTTGAVKYLWKFNTKDTSTKTSPNNIFNYPGKFDVSLTATSAMGCKSVVLKNKYVEVIARPRTKFEFTPLNANFLNPVITFKNLSTNFTSFEWDFGDLTKEKDTLNPTHKYAEDTGSYWVILTSKNRLNQCSDSVSMFVQIRDIYALYIPNAISVNNDGFNEELKIVGRGIKTFNLSIYNRWGAKIFNTNSVGTNFNGRTPSGEMMPKGSYLLTLEVKDIFGKVHYVKQTLEIL